MSKHMGTVVRKYLLSEEEETSEQTLALGGGPSAFNG